MVVSKAFDNRLITIFQRKDMFKNTNENKNKKHSFSEHEFWTKGRYFPSHYLIIYKKKQNDRRIN